MRARGLAAVTIILAVAGFSNVSAQNWGGRPQPANVHHGDNDAKCDRDHDRWDRRGHDRDDDQNCCTEDKSHGNRWGWGRHDDDHRDGRAAKDSTACGGTPPAAGGTISGYVSGDNGVMTGWTVYLIGSTSRSTTTGADGSYSFTNVAAGTYTVCEADPTPAAEEIPANGSSSNAVPCTTGAPFGYSLALTAGGTLIGNSFLNGSGGVAF